MSSLEVYDRISRIAKKGKRQNNDADTFIISSSQLGVLKHISEQKEVCFRQIVIKVSYCQIKNRSFWLFLSFNLNTGNIINRSLYAI